MSKPSALIIEDSPVFSLMFSRTLSDEFEVEVIQDGGEALTAFTETRKVVLDKLNGEPELWERAGQHFRFGPTTVRELLRITTNHDRSHIQQTWKILNGG